MRSATYNEFGKPSEVLSINESPTPEPKNNEVRIKTILSSIHNHDIVTIKANTVINLICLPLVALRRLVRLMR